jgi:hypothetical protein
MGVGQLSRLSDDGADPFMSLCHIGLQLERELGELVWELPTLGPGVPSFFIIAYHGLGDQELLGSGSRPSDHPKHHALLRAAVAGPDPLKPAF